MSFVWPARRGDSHGRGAVTVAIALTAAAVGALSPSFARLYRVHVPAAEASGGEPAEVAVYVVPPVVQAPAPRRMPPAPERRLSREVKRFSASLATVDSGPRSRVAAESATVSSGKTPNVPDAPAAAAPLPGSTTPTHAAIGPVAAPVGVTRAPVGTAPYVPLRLRTEWKSFWDLVRDTKPTPAQRDSSLKEQEQTRVAARDAGRPMPLGLGHFRLPLFSRGPSHAQLQRDSIVNADYLRRLAILQARARAMQDSARRADSARRVAAGVKRGSRP